MVGIVVAFKQHNVRDGIYGSPNIGLKNFEFLFKTNDAWLITRNAILYNLVFIVLGTVLAIAVAILLNEIRSRPAKQLYQNLYPHPLPDLYGGGQLFGLRVFERRQRLFEQFHSGCPGEGTHQLVQRPPILALHSGSRLLSGAGWGSPASRKAVAICLFVSSPRKPFPHACSRNCRYRVLSASGRSGFSFLRIQSRVQSTEGTG